MKPSRASPAAAGPRPLISFLLPGVPYEQVGRPMSLGSEIGVKSRAGGVRGVLLAGVLPRRRPPPPPLPALLVVARSCRTSRLETLSPPGSRMTAVDLSANGGFAGLRRHPGSRVPATPAGGGGSRPPGCPGGHWRAASRRSARGSDPQVGGLAPAGPGKDLVPRTAASQLAQPPGGPGGTPVEQAAEEERQERPARGDIPVRRDGRRACKRTALQAALPENQLESLADLDGAILARSSEGPFRSRVRTWVDLTAAWALPAWPISLDSVRKVAASLRRGRYRSAQNYFDAAVTYQEHFRGESVDPLLRRALRRYAKAVARGLAGSKLKTIFPAMRLEPLLDTSPASAAEPWNPFLVAHAADALLLAVWFMLREIEFAAARTEDIGGERELTARQLRCACGVRSRPMCPAHAAMRHVSRLKMAGFWRRGGPLFPDAAGATWAKGETVMLFRRVLLAAGVTLTTVDPPRAAVRRPRGEGSRGGVAGIQRSADGDHPVAGSLVLDGGGAICPGSAVGGGPGDPRQGPVGRQCWRGGPRRGQESDRGWRGAQ